jgi:hypothetical protein
VRQLALRALLSLLAVAALVGLALVRLARVPRPRARALARFAGGGVVVERVTLRERVIGHVVRCDGGAVFERFGERPPTAREVGGAVVLSDRGCRVSVAPQGCRVERVGTCGRP